MKHTSWSLYALQRLTGFELRPIQPGADPFAEGAKVEEAFLPVAAPSRAIPDRRNEFYRIASKELWGCAKRSVGHVAKGCS